MSGVAERLRGGSQDYPGLQAQAARELEENGFHTDYVAIRRAADLHGEARLIDNIEVVR